MSKLISGILGGALLGAAGSAAAMPVVFDWSNLGNGYDYITNTYTATNSATNPDLTVKITGYNGQVYVDRRGSNPDGLGVWSGRGDSDDVDGWGPDQGLFLSFSEEVTLEGLRFLDGDHNYSFLNTRFAKDEFDLFADGTSVLNGHNIEEHDVNGRVKLAGYTGTQFLVRADDSNDAWYLNGLTVTRAVPEPGSFALFGIGLAALGLTRRKR